MTVFTQFCNCSLSFSRYSCTRTAQTCSSQAAQAIPKQYPNSSTFVITGSSTGDIRRKPGSKSSQGSTFFAKNRTVIFQGNIFVFKSPAQKNAFIHCLDNLNKLTSVGKEIITTNLEKKSVLTYNLRQEQGIAVHFRSDRHQLPCCGFYWPKKTY